MVTVRSAIQVGFRLVNKNRRLLIVPLVWEYVRALLIYGGFSMGAFWPPSAGFFVRFALPVSWPSLDRILPTPLLSPDFALLLTGRLAGKEVSFLLAILAYALLDSLARGWFLLALREAFAGQKVQLVSAFYGAFSYLNRFFILRLLTLVGLLCLTAFAKQFPYVPRGVWELLLTLGTLSATFVDLVIIFTKTPMPMAYLKGFGLIERVGAQLISFLIWGSIINALVSIPLNWAVGTLPGLLLADALYIYLGVMLSAALMYLFTTYLLTHREG